MRYVFRTVFYVARALALIVLALAMTVFVDDGNSGRAFVCFALILFLLFADVSVEDDSSDH